MPSCGDGRWLWTAKTVCPGQPAPCHPAVTRYELVSAGETMVLVQLLSQLDAVKNVQFCRLVESEAVQRRAAQLHAGASSPSPMFRNAGHANVSSTVMMQGYKQLWLLSSEA